jgi:integrase
MVHEFRAALLKQHKLATSTARQTIRTVKMVYAWGEANELIDRNRIHAYKFKVAKEQRTESPAEYSGDETAKMMAALDPKSATQWRAWVALTICGNQGVRQNAALHLQWDDVDELLGVMIWRSQWDKMGREWSQPIRSATREALRVAREWREKNEYAGPWVLPQGSSKSKSEVYTLGSLWQALKGAETRSGVARINRRGGHSLRRKWRATSTRRPATRRWRCSRSATPISGKRTPT